MAVRIPLDSLTSEDAHNIRTHLFMQPKSTYHVKNNFFSSDTGPAPFQFYMATNDYVDVPMAFGSIITKKPPNRDLNHLPVQLDFREEMNLLEPQAEVVVEALDYLKTYGTTHLGLHTGFGKTCVSIWLASQLKWLTLVLVDQTNIVVQWVEAFKKFTSNAIIWVVGEKFPIIPADRQLSVIICMVGRIHHIPSDWLDLIGTVIVDEAHCFCTGNRSAALLAPHPRYFISCTATLTRPDGMEKVIQSIVGVTEIHRVSQRPFNFYQVNTHISIPTHVNKMGTLDFTQLVTDLSSLECRNRVILQLASDLVMSGRKVLIMTQRTAHAKYIWHCLDVNRYSVDYMAGFKNLYTDSHILVGSYKKLGKAFDEETACSNYQGTRLNALIICISFRSSIMLNQMVGRVFRSNYPRIYDLVDSIGILKNQWKDRKKWYLAANGSHYIHEVEWDT